MLTISNKKTIIEEATMDSRDERLVEIILKYREELQRKLEKEKLKWSLIIMNIICYIMH